MNLPEFFRDISPYFVLLVIGLFLLLLGQGILIIDAPYITYKSTNADPITSFLFTILGIIIMILGLYLLVAPYFKNPGKTSGKSNVNNSNGYDDNYVRYHEFFSIKESIKEKVNGEMIMPLFVSVQNENNILKANGTIVTNTEKFKFISKMDYSNTHKDIVCYGHKVSIFAEGNERYVRAIDDGNYMDDHPDHRVLKADRIEPLSDETFILEPYIPENNQENINKLNKPIEYGDQISLKCFNNSLYVKSEKWDKNKTLSANAPHKKNWESFTLMKSPK